MKTKEIGKITENFNREIKDQTVNDSFDILFCQGETCEIKKCFFLLSEHANM